MAYDHLNVIERKLIDNLRTGTYNIVGGTSTAWSEGDVTVYGQFPTTDEIKYPCIIAEMTANGLEEQFMGQSLTYSKPNSNVPIEALGELYGVGFNIHVAVNRESVLQAEWTDPTLSTTNTSTTATISNTAQLTVGTTIAGTNIPVGTTISSITNGTTFIISAAATGTGSDITATFTAPFKERRLINFLMLNCANVIMDCDFLDTSTEIVERHYSGFREMGYNTQLELWAAVCSMVIVFKNNR